MIDATDQIDPASSADQTSTSEPVTWSPGRLLLAMHRALRQLPRVGLPDRPWQLRVVGGQVGPRIADRLVVMTEEAHRSAWSWASGDLQHERGGFLLGSYGQLEDGTDYTVVQAFVPAIGGIGTRGSFKFTADAWTYGETVKQDEYPDLRWAGWFHSHPGYGVFLSGWDTSLFDLAFHWDHHVAYVIDPCHQEEGLFVRRNGVRVGGPSRAVVVIEQAEWSIVQAAGRERRCSGRGLGAETSNWGH
jgi:proteasome lid subunit RPN8/RPN11